MNCLVRSFSQYGGGPASLASQTTPSEVRKFDRLPRIGLWFFSIIVFCSSLKSLGFRRWLSWDPQTHFLSKKVYILIVFLGAFAKLRKATISFVMSVRLSVRAKQLGSHWMDFMKFDTWGFLEDLSRNIRRNYNLTRINGTLHEDQYTFFFIIFRSFLVRMRNVSDKSVAKIKTHIACSVAILKNRTVYENMRKNIVERGRPQMTIWRMRIACWIPKATNTHTQAV